MPFAAFSPKTHFLAATSVFALLSAIAPVSAQTAQTAAAAPQTAATAPVKIDDAIETIVVTGTKFDADAAPAKASLDTAQPQTIINRSYIEDFAPPAADYVTILQIAPSLTGTDTNGPGLSDGGVKNTMRGLPDGQYGMSYDGIPFGDTNGPSHHSLSYFPGSTIGSVLVDRGPGNAGTLGAATYGGTVKLFSDVLGDDMHAKGTFSYGSFNTRVISGNIQSGALGGDDNATRIMVNLQDTASDGALSFQDLEQKNALIKISHDFGSDWKVTLFGTYNYLNQHLNDSAGSTPAQIAAYGKDFALQNTDPNLSTYVEYNWVNKKTDMDYARIQGTIIDGLKLDDTLYTYFYLNHTFSATSTLQTATDIANGTTQGQGGSKVPIVGGVKQPATDVPGYTKVNAFRVWGNILRLSDDYQIGSVYGQVRAGAWYESNKTWRGRYDFDRSLCYRQNVDPFAIANTASCADSQLVASGKAIKLPNGFAEYDEHSAWYQYQPFLEVDIKPTEDLTITPGVKYINWIHKTNGLEQKLIQFYKGEYTTEKTLPFVEVNYKITPTWSIYAQYAKGVYVPDIGSFENSSGPITTYPEAQTTTNYQIGTVFYADSFTFDADLYDIPVNNNISYVPCTTIGGAVGQTCAVNTGKALYKGVEGEATYAFEKGTGGFFDGLSAFVNGSVMYAKSNGVTLKQAPGWTFAGGLMYKHDGWKFSVIDKSIGSQYSDNAENQNYKVASYSNVSLTAGYTFSFVELSLSLDNLLDSRKAVAITENDKTFQTNRLNSTDQYYYQAPRSIMGTIKVHY
jgi:iron complex outermembrane receptor protein